MASRRNLQGLNAEEIYQTLFAKSDDEESCTADASTEEELSSDDSEEEDPIIDQVRPSVPSGAS